ncbi:MAG: DNA polymerase, partial [Candidatus Competibacterales bacterium]|nr:DNA polymerase [Candidatus Competibacterales bacterium]
RGYVETLRGRRLYLREINVRNAARRQAAERTAINAPMQGTAADIIKRAMLAIERDLAGDRSGARMILQVHDELVFEVPGDRLEELGERIRKRMEQAAGLTVPLRVEIGSGDDWEAAH